MRAENSNAVAPERIVTKFEAPKAAQYFLDEIRRFFS
jgi:hypothetical protein